jgi:hypothetical protein
MGEQRYSMQNFAFKKEKKNAHGKLTSQLYDKQDDLNFAIVNSKYIYSNIPASSANGVFISTDSICKGLLSI